MASGFEMRVGDAEREATAAELREHYASGRLTLDELNERLDKAFAAKTRADLSALMTDLPSARPGSPAGGRAAGAGGSGAGGWPSGPGGMFGSQGPLGPGGPLGRGGAGAGGAWAGPARAAGAILSTFVVICALFLFGMLGLFGIGAGRPFAIALIIAALALLRRLLFRRRGVRACSRRRW